MKIWFQNRRTKWKKQDNISNTEAAEHKNTTSTKGQGDTKSNCTSSPPPDSPVPQQMHHHSTPIGSSKPNNNGHHSNHFGSGEKKHHPHNSSSSSSSSKYKQKLSRDEALFKTQSPAAAAAYLPHHNPLFSMMAGHQLPLVGLEHHPHQQHHNDVEARLAASRISISAFSKVGESSHGMELSQMLSIGAMGRMPRP